MARKDTNKRDSWLDYKPEIHSDLTKDQRRKVANLLGVTDYQAQIEDLRRQLAEERARLVVAVAALTRYAEGPAENGLHGVGARYALEQIQSTTTLADIRRDDITICAGCMCPLGQIDTVLTSEQWQLVCPEGGELCAACIVQRAAKLPNAINTFLAILFADDYDQMIEHKDGSTHPIVIASMCPKCINTDIRREAKREAYEECAEIAEGHYTGDGAAGTIRRKKEEL